MKTSVWIAGLLLSTSGCGEPDAGNSHGESAADASREQTDAASRDAGQPENPPAVSVRDAQLDAPETGVLDAGSGSACSTGLCTDFEETAGALPTGWRAVSPNCSGDGTATVVSDVAHTGSRSLRIQSGGGVCNHVFATPALEPAVLQGELWLRFYVRLATPLTAAHVTFLALHDQVTGKDLRMGGQNEILMWNREQDDATLPELSPKGVSLSVAPRRETWQCIELHLAAQNGALETYFEGTRVEALVIDGTATQDIDGQWLRPGPFRAQPTDLRFGWESYGGQPMTLWFDDVAIGNARIGC